MRIQFVALALLFCAGPALGMELGQTKESIVAEHGKATEENHSKNTAVYRSGPWKVDVEFREGAAWQLTFTRLGQLTEEELQSILDQNAGGKQWRELSEAGPKRSWQRDDSATAECDRVKPRSITFRAAPPSSLQKSADDALMAEEQSSTPNDKAAETPSVYAIEQSSPASAATAAPTVPTIGLASRIGAFIDQRPLVIVLPAVLLLLAWLINAILQKPGTPVARKRRIITPRRANDAMATESVPAGLDSLNEDDFELLVGEIFRREGYTVEMSGGIGSDGGNDLTLRKKNELVAVQCRHWNSYKVSAPSIQELYGAVMATGATSGIFVTSGVFTNDAREFAEGKPIRLVDRSALEQIMEQVSHPGENMCLVPEWMDGFASSVAVVDPACPFCGRGMKLKRGVQGRPFWACQTFPACGGKRDGRVELLRGRAATAE